MTIYFDGICNLCNGFVNWLITHDSHQMFRYASLQGKTAQTTLPEDDRNKIKSIVVQAENGALSTESQAIMMILKALPAPYKYIGHTLQIFPIFFLNWIYRLIAKNRYQFYGQRQTCRIPSEEEKTFFLP